MYAELRHGRSRAKTTPLLESFKLCRHTLGERHALKIRISETYVQIRSEVDVMRLLRSCVGGLVAVSRALPFSFTSSFAEKTTSLRILMKGLRIEECAYRLSDSVFSELRT